MKKIIISLLLLPLASFAATTTANFNANANLNSSCTISANNVDFGSINSLVTSFANNTISILCTKGTSYTITGKAFRPDGSHLMTGTNGNTDVLNYTVNLTSNFNDAYYFGAPYANLVTSGTGTTQSHNLYYRMRSAINKSVAPDNYSDNYTLTLTY